MFQILPVTKVCLLAMKTSSKILMFFQTIEIQCKEGIVSK